MLTPLFALAQANVNQGFGTPQNSGPAGYAAPQNSGPVGKSELMNPLKVTNFCQLIKIVLDAILIIGMPIAVVFLVLVGFKFILAQGNPEKIHDAQKNFLNTVIGIAIFLGAWTIAKIIAATLQGLGVSAVNECVR
jgi:hypothetical protein